MMQATIVPILIASFFAGTPTQAGLNQLCEVIDHYCKPINGLQCLEYDEYGCWCGFGGSGTPVDDTDKCCQAHDFCYDKIIADKNCTKSPYFEQYTHENGTCAATNTECRKSTCECDRALAVCLSTAKFQWKFWGHRFLPRNCKN